MHYMRTDAITAFPPAHTTQIQLIYRARSIPVGSLSAMDLPSPDHLWRGSPDKTNAAWKLNGSQLILNPAWECAHHHSTATQYGGITYVRMDAGKRIRKVRASSRSRCRSLESEPHTGVLKDRRHHWLWAGDFFGSGVLLDAWAEGGGVQSPRGKPERQSRSKCGCSFLISGCLPSGNFGWMRRTRNDANQAKILEENWRRRCSERWETRSTQLRDFPSS